MTDGILGALSQGFGSSAAHLISVSALNAFVLRQAISRQHPVAAGLAGVGADLLFILLGVTGVGALLAHAPWLAPLAAWGGAAFLFWHGVKAFRAARRPQTLPDQDGVDTPQPVRSVVATALGLTLLNPHPYADSVVLFGALAAPLGEGARAFFALGALTASCAWYGLLAMGGQRLAPVFRSPLAWRWLDGLVGTLLWSFALLLIWRAWQGQLGHQ